MHEALIEKIKALPPEALDKVEEYIDTLSAEELVENNSVKKPSFYGSMKDIIIYIAPDFNEPLDDLKDYM